MKLPKTEMKLPTPEMSFHDNMYVDTNRSTTFVDGWTSVNPMFVREVPKSLPEDGHHHIYGTAANNIALPILGESTMTLSSSSQHSSHSSVDRTYTSFCSVGLPSEYPLHRKSTSFSSVTVEEELEDFEIFEDDLTTNRRRAISFPSATGYSPFADDVAPASRKRDAPTAARLKNGAKRLDHWRQRTQTGSFDRLAADSKSSRKHRRGRNQALGPKDFHESVLTELFEEASLEPPRD